MKKFISLLLCFTILTSLTACQTNEENLYNDYSNRLEEAVKQVKVPVAKENIAPNQIINFDMIEIIDLDKSQLSEDTIINSSQILGKRAITNISKGSTFNTQNIAD